MSIAETSTKRKRRLLCRRSHTTVHQNCRRLWMIDLLEIFELRQVRCDEWRILGIEGQTRGSKHLQKNMPDYPSDNKNSSDCDGDTHVTLLKRSMTTLAQTLTWSKQCSLSRL